MRRLPIDDLVADNLRRVLSGVDLNFVVVGRLSRTGARSDHDRFAGGQQAVHAGRGNADSLLAASLLQRVEFRSVEQLPEDPRYLCLDDSRAIVIHGDSEPVFCELLDVDFQGRKDSRFLAGIERVVDGFLYRGQKGFLGIIEPQEVSILGEEFRNGDLPLPCRHAFRGLTAIAFRFLLHGKRAGLRRTL